MASKSRFVANRNFVFTAENQALPYICILTTTTTAAAVVIAAATE